METHHFEQLVQIPIDSIKLEGANIRAVVSRGGRPDLVKEVLARVQSSTFLIVGGNDDKVIELKSEAYSRLKGKKQLVIIPRATLAE